MAKHVNGNIASADRTWQNSDRYASARGQHSRNWGAHLRSLATGLVVFVGAMGLMQMLKSTGNHADAGVANVARGEIPAVTSLPLPSGSSTSSATEAGLKWNGGSDEAAPATDARLKSHDGATQLTPGVTPSVALASQRQGVPEVYIHVLNGGAREQVRLLELALSRNGITVAGIKVVNVGPRSSDLRYFRHSEKEEALRVQAILLSLGLPARRLKSIPGFEASAVPRRYELWLASDFKG